MRIWLSVGGNYLPQYTHFDVWENRTGPRLYHCSTNTHDLALCLKSGSLATGSSFGQQVIDYLGPYKPAGHSDIPTISGSRRGRHVEPENRGFRRRQFDWTGLTLVMGHRTCPLFLSFFFYFFFLPSPMSLSFPFAPWSHCKSLVSIFFLTTDATTGFIYLGFVAEFA